MNRLSLLLAAVPTVAIAAVVQTAPMPSAPIVGTWVLVKADKILPDGQQVEDYGSAPHGLVVFTADGHYSLQIYRADRPHFVSGDRAKATPEEYKEDVLGMSVHFGTYTLDSAHSTILFHVDRSSFPNTDDTTRATPFELKGDILSWTLAPRPDGARPVTVLRRVH